MDPRNTVPWAALALLVGGAAAAQQPVPARAPTVQPVAKPAAPKKPGSNLPPHAGGKLEVEAASFDAGRVERGGKVTHTFLVKNTGTGPLHLDAKPG